MDDVATGKNSRDQGKAETGIQQVTERQQPGQQAFDSPQVQWQRRSIDE